MQAWTFSLTAPAARVAAELSAPAPTVDSMNTTDARVLIAAAARHETAPAGNSALIAAEFAAARCRWCNDELEHCHDSLVVHAIGEAHCMGTRCTTPPELHHLVVDCADFGCTCALDGSAASAGVA